ncbi:glutamate-cysteine ligase-domain-containing protein [Spinellus fusiger]|nr:glutamate-cysteine ligase-domain-containing protein [Spinellus fusiger]
MGLLSLGTPLPWNEAKKHSDHVKVHGIEQFLHIYHSQKHLDNQSLLWGDEIEYLVVEVDKEEKKASLSLQGHEILARLQVPEQDYLSGQTTTVPSSLWRPEYGRYMIEGTPGEPYGSTLQDLLTVEPSMRLRRRTATDAMKPNQRPVTIVSYPRLGCSDGMTPYHKPEGVVCKSLFSPDEAISPHARFPTLTSNIHRRRGAKVAINTPIFHDTNTPKPFIDPTIPWDRNIFESDKEAREGAAKPDHIYMDTMMFGMGCCCLQITFQACNVEEARQLYDQLAPMTPVMMALTAASPTFRGYLADVDCRWNVIAAAVDDRTRGERSLEPLKDDRFVINKSRYDSIDTYLSRDPTNKPKYNDLDLVYDHNIYDKLRENDIDDLLAKHVSHLFIREPLVIYEELLDQDDTSSSDHFENLQSTNWQTVRFKPPPPNSNIGWRVEFRSMEVQLTDFENAAFSVFAVLLTRVILSYKLNLYIPISKIDSNMQTAQKRGAVLDEKFYFRKNIFPSTSETESEDGDAYELMTINEIMNGKEGGFFGFIPLIRKYLGSAELDVKTHEKLLSYLSLISRRASGELMTTATYIRQFVRNHPSYKHDSVVSQEINFDLLETVDKITKGELKVPELMSDFAA